MPVIIPAGSYDRWLANIEPDPRDLLVPYPSGPDEVIQAYVEPDGSISVKSGPQATRQTLARR